MRNRLGLLLLLFTATATTTAHAADGGADTSARREAAKRFADSGNRLFEQGRFADAAREFEHAFDELPLPGFGYNAGSAYDKAGLRQPALAMWRHYLELPDRDRKDDASVRARIAVLERELAPPPPAKEARPAFPYLESTTRHPFQTTLTIGGREYLLVGAGARSVLGFKVYAMGLYVEAEAARAAFPKLVGQAGGADVETLRRGDFASQFLARGEFGKRAVMHFLRPVDARKQMQSYKDLLGDDLGEAAPPQLKQDAAAFVALFDRDVKTDDDLIIHTDPDGKVWVKVDGGPLREGPKSLRLEYDIWNIWLGARPIAADLKKKLSERIDVLGR